MKKPSVRREGWAEENLPVLPEEGSPPILVVSNSAWNVV